MVGVMARNTIRTVVLGTVIGLALSGDAAADVSFSDQATAADLIFTTSVPMDVTQRSMYPGGAVGDFNRDGRPDIFLLGGGGVADSPKFKLF